MIELQLIKNQWRGSYTKLRRVNGVYVSAGAASSRRGDHLGLLAINPCHTYKTCPNYNHSSPYKQKQLMASFRTSDQTKKKINYHNNYMSIYSVNCV